MKKAEVERVNTKSFSGKDGTTFTSLLALQPEHAIKYLKLNTWQSRTHEQTLLKTEHRTTISPISNSRLKLPQAEQTVKSLPGRTRPKFVLKGARSESLSRRQHMTKTPCQVEHTAKILYRN